MAAAAVGARGAAVAATLGLHALLLGSWGDDATLRGLPAMTQNPVQVRLLPAPAAPAPMPAPARQAPKAGLALRPPAAVPAAPAQAAGPAQPITVSAAGEFEGYVPRPLLSEPPQLQTPVVIPEPAGPGAGVGARRGVLALFIDEEGRVRAVQGQEPRLPPAYEEAAREAFLAAHYLPGRIDGRAVKSRLRVEVVVGAA